MLEMNSREFEELGELGESEEHRDEFGDHEDCLPKNALQSLQSRLSI